MYIYAYMYIYVYICIYIYVYIYIKHTPTLSHTHHLVCTRTSLFLSLSLSLSLLSLSLSTHMHTPTLGRAPKKKNARTNAHAKRRWPKVNFTDSQHYDRPLKKESGPNQSLRSQINMNEYRIPRVCMCVCVCVCVCVCTCVHDTHVRMLCAYFALLSPTPCTTLSSLLSPRPLLPAVFSLHVSRSFSGRCGWERAARGTRHRVPRNVRERQTLFGGPWTLERERERERGAGTCL